MMTEKIVAHLERIPDGWRGDTSKKPANLAVNEVKRILSTLEEGHMPFPSVDAVSNGGLILTWNSLTRDIVMTIDTDGDVQFVTSLKVLDRDMTEVIDRMDSEGQIVDMRTIDHMMAWYMSDRAGKC